MEIIVITNEEKKKLLGFIINGIKHERKPKQEYSDFYREMMTKYGSQFAEACQNRNYKVITKENLTKVEQKLYNYLSKEPKISNVKVYNNVNKCKEEIISGKQIALSHSEYTLGTMYATQDIGKEKENQEDAVLILEHPQNKEFKLLAVADGTGKNNDGHMASNPALSHLIHWFEALPVYLYEDLDMTKRMLDVFIKQLVRGRKTPEEVKTTLSLVVIGKEQTLIANVGDSRIYTVKNDEVTQETIDDTVTQKLIDENIIAKGLGRFYRMNGRVENLLSKTNEDYKGANYKIINNDYDKILAVTDGIIDCLSEKDLEEIIIKSKNEQLTNNLVEKSLTNDTIIDEDLRQLPRKQRKQAVKSIKNTPLFYKGRVHGGKDNSSAAAYIKR